MSDDARKVIADVLGRHRIEQGMRIGGGERIEWWECLECGWTSGEHEIGTNLEPLKRDHLAAEIDTALGGLSREWGARMTGDTETSIVTEGTARYCATQHPETWTVLSRYVTDWAEVTP